MNNNKRNSGSTQQSSVEAKQLNKNRQVKNNDDLVLAKKMKLNQQIELDNPNFVLGYN